MKKCFALFFAFSPLLFSSCLDSGDDLDAQSPTIGAASSMQTIMPSYFLEVGAEVSSIPLAFQVEDETGISQIMLGVHSAFDGHTHGRIANTNIFRNLGYRHRISHQDMEDPRRFQVEISDSLFIYLDDRNPLIPGGQFIRAGPYHFSISATDTLGNATSYADNSTYHTTLYIHREYAPLIQVDRIDKGTGTVEGSVRRNMEHELSSDIGFLWVYISRPDPANPNQEGEVSKEWIRGTAGWQHNSRDDSGDSLPDPQNIDLAELLSGEEAISQMDDAEILTIWAEDSLGNISVKSF